MLCLPNHEFSLNIVGVLTFETFSGQCQTIVIYLDSTWLIFGGRVYGLSLTQIYCPGGFCLKNIFSTKITSSNELQTIS